MDIQLNALIPLLSEYLILLPKTKPVIIGIIFRPSNQSNFLEIIKVNYILGDFMDQNNKYIVRDGSTVSSKFFLSDIKNYDLFCTMHGLKQLIKSPIHVTCSSSTLIDHVLASFPLRVSQKGVFDVRYLITTYFLHTKNFMSKHRWYPQVFELPFI